jgi:arylsulfatase
LADNRGELILRAPSAIPRPPAFATPALRSRAGPALALAVLALAAAGCGGRAPARSAPANLILITVDTLRADHLGAYGYPLATSPSLDALAREGTVFAACYSQSATTAASHATLFTSRYPQSTGVRSNAERFPDQPSLMAVLRHNGYTAAGFVSSVVVGRKFGIQKEFDAFDDAATTTEATRRERGERPAEATLAAALAKVDEIAGRGPFFLWVHLIDPHGPYQAPREPDRFVGDPHYAPERRELAIGASNWVWGEIPAYQALPGATDAALYLARYDGEIRYVDDALGGFLAGLRARSLYDDSFVVVTADHGETLLDAAHKRLFSHGTIAYEEVVRVPLIVKEPRGVRSLDELRDERVRLLDLAPTLLALLDLPPEPGFQGRDIRGPGGGARLPVFSFGSYGSTRLESRVGTQFTVLKGSFRYLLNTLDGSEELYDHTSDPGEARNLAPANPAVREALRQELADFLTRTPRAGSELIEESREHSEALKALGYL